MTISADASDDVDSSATGPDVPTRFVAELPAPLMRQRGTAGANGGQTVRDVPLAFGPLRVLLEDPRVTDVFVNASGDVWVDRGEGVHRLRALHLASPDARRLAVALVALGGRHVDEATPCADVRLADGIRVHVVLPPVSRGGTLVSIRVPSIRMLSLHDLEVGGFFSTVPLPVLLEHVERRANLLITGAGGTGKTTLLGALLAAASPSDRIVTIEDVAELRIPHPHVVSLETRQANLEGAGTIDLARLVREALRMRPDRLVVGECRGAELRELLTALNTGHDGGAGTLHANGIESVPARLEALGSLAGLSPEALGRQAVSAFDAVVHLERGPSGRRVAGVAAFALARDGRLAVSGKAVSGRAAS